MKVLFMLALWLVLPSSLSPVSANHSIPIPDTDNHLPKECREVIRQLQADGWEVYPERQQSLEVAYIAYWQKWQDGNGSNKQSYEIMGSAIAHTSRQAFALAQQDAQTQLASLQGTVVDAVVSTSQTSVQSSDGQIDEHETIDVVSRAQAGQTIKGFVPQMSLFRTLPDGQSEVRLFFLVDADVKTEPVVVLIPQAARTAREAEVEAEARYEVGEFDNVTLNQAKLRCISLARAEAIRREFGELVSSDVATTSVETENLTSTAFYENIISSVKGDWLSDVEKTEIGVSYQGEKLVFTAHVHGLAREVIQARVNLKWDILAQREDGSRQPSTDFHNRERFFMNFHAPAKGYLAVYLSYMESDETYRLLPYRNDATKRYELPEAGDYDFFRERYIFDNVQPGVEQCQFIVVYSPNPFIVTDDELGDKKSPSQLRTRDFQTWLNNVQRQDREMVVDKRWVSVRNLLPSEH